MSALPSIPGPQAARVNKDLAADMVWYQYEAAVHRVLYDLNNNYVPQSRKIIAGAGLTGGGDLSADVTLSVSGTGTGVPTTRLISTTAPLTGGGDLSADRTLGITGAALTKTDDTNVTLTLGGTPASALVTAASLTVGWAGTLAVGRGGTGEDLSATGGTSQVLKQVSAGAPVTVGQLAAADLSNYATGTWTPVLTFSTPGNLSVTYSIQEGTYTKIGGMVLASFSIATSAFTWTTASGQVAITGIPFTAINLSGAHWAGAMVAGGITKASYTQFVVRILTNASTIDVMALGSGVSAAPVATTDMPSGGTVVLRGTLLLEVQ